MRNYHLCNSISVGFLASALVSIVIVFQQEFNLNNRHYARSNNELPSPREPNGKRAGFKCICRPHSDWLQWWCDASLCLLDREDTISVSVFAGIFWGALAVASLSQL